MKEGKTLLKKLSKLMHRVVVIFFPSNLTLSFEGIGKWCSHNGIFLYPKETFITLRSRKIFGYGVRPIGRIIGYVQNSEDIKGDLYVIEMEYDKGPDVNFHEYMKTGQVKGSPIRMKEIQRHFKRNIERQFVEISV